MAVEGFVTEARQIRVANFDIFQWLPLITRFTSLTLTIIRKVQARDF